MKVFVLIVLIWGTNIMAQAMMAPELTYDMVDPLSRESDDPKVIERNLQIMFVEELFTRPIYSSEMNSLDSEEDQNMGLYEKQYFNDMMSRKMAEFLVDQDIFNLESQFEGRHR